MAGGARAACRQKKEYLDGSQEKVGYSRSHGLAVFNTINEIARQDQHVL